MNQLVKEGIEMDRQYVYKYCSPTRTAIQSGRNPYHVNPLNAAPEIYNPADPVSGMAAMPRNSPPLSYYLLSNVGSSG